MPNRAVGAILGKGGSNVMKLQLMSQTKIRVSQKGEFVQGTTDRVVTISGPSRAHTDFAQQLVAQQASIQVSYGIPSTMRALYHSRPSTEAQVSGVRVCAPKC